MYDVRCHFGTSLLSLVSTFRSPVSFSFTSVFFPLSKVMQSARQNAFVVLGVTSASGDADVGAAFRELARAHHPDKGGNASTMALLPKYSWYSQDIFLKRNSNYTKT